VARRTASRAVQACLATRTSGVARTRWRGHRRRRIGRIRRGRRR
jgi:hypothetical protein